MLHGLLFIQFIDITIVVNSVFDLFLCALGANGVLFSKAPSIVKFYRGLGTLHPVLIADFTNSLGLQISLDFDLRG